MGNYNEIIKELEKYKCSLVAVSKTKSESEILKVYDLGQRIFGENRVQELIQKQKTLPEDIEWHMIGHLQKNKVKQIVPFVSMIHSVDNIPLLEAINRRAEMVGRKIAILLQFKIAREETKFGFDLDAFLDEFDPSKYHHVIFSGVMGMASFTEEMDVVRQEFQKLVEIKKLLTKKYFEDSDAFFHISMGMSGDYKVALEEGSTMVRIGSLIFGARV